MADGPARPDPRSVVTVLGALVVGGVVGTLLAGLWLGEGSGDAGPSVPLFAVAASPLTPQPDAAAGDLAFSGQLTVLNPGRLPIAVSRVTGELSGLTVVGEESPGRNIPVGGQNRVSVKVVVPRAQCPADQTGTAFPEPIPLTVTLVGASQQVATSLQVSGTGWEQSVRVRCAPGTANS